MALLPSPLNPGLRPWVSNGLARLVVDEAVLQAVRGALAAPPAPPSRNGPAPQIVPAAAAPLPSRATPPPASREASGPRADGFQTEKPRTAGPRSPEAPPQPAFPKSESQNGPASWPAIWRERLAKTPPNPRLVWTYPELALDLRGQGDKARGNFFRELFRQLGMPAGSQAFWPLWLHDAELGAELAAHWGAEGEAGDELPPELGARLDTELAFFRAGLRRLRPETVLLLGGLVPRLLGLADLRPLQPHILKGWRFVRLHRVETLLADPDQRRLVTFLRTLHSPITG